MVGMTNPCYSSTKKAQGGSGAFTEAIRPDNVKVRVGPGDPGSWQVVAGRSLWGMLPYQSKQEHLRLRRVAEKKPVSIGGRQEGQEPLLGSHRLPPERLWAKYPCEDASQNNLRRWGVGGSPKRQVMG